MKVLTSKDIFNYFKPSICPRRIYLDQRQFPKLPSRPTAELMIRLGNEHERRHLNSMPEFIDLSTGEFEKRLILTQKHVKANVPAIYHGLLRASVKLNGRKYNLIGEPDFMIKVEKGKYLVRDCKMAKRINDKDHPEILIQLYLYGYLFETTFGYQPELQVLDSDDEIINLNYGQVEINSLRKTLSIIAECKNSKSEPYSCVGWSKCNLCPFKDHCWDRALRAKEIGIVLGIDQGLAEECHKLEVETLSDFLKYFDIKKLSELKRPWGKGYRKVGKKAKNIIASAKAIQSNKAIVLDKADIPDSENYVMFDLEGLPPHINGDEQVYLWGMQVFGDKPGDFMSGIAGFGEDGDLKGWTMFLKLAEFIFKEYGDIPWMHWASYEKTKIKLYIERYDDKNGIGQRVLNNLFDLLPVIKNSVALPLSSYSLKVIEEYIGFERTQDEYGGDWAIAKYIEAIGSNDQNIWSEAIDEIVTYNREDLLATWEVFKFFKYLF